MSAINGPITRSEVMSRAQNWVDRRVPYSQSAFASDPDCGKTYRQDCSGYVSMCWHLDTSLTTTTLPGRATAISKTEVKAGDALAYPGHVALVAAPPSGGNVTIYQQRGPGYVAQKVTNPLSLYSNAYRYRNITDDVDHTPIGNLERFEAVGDTLRIVGWALSKATTASVTVQVVIDGIPAATVAANLSRPDLVGPYDVGPNHGFDLTVPVFGGQQSVAVNVINSNVQPPTQITLGAKAFAIGTTEQIRAFLNATWIDLLYRSDNPSAITEEHIADFNARGTRGIVGLYVDSKEHGFGFIRRSYRALMGREPRQDELDLHWNGMVAGISEKHISMNIAVMDECWQRFGGTSQGWITGLYQAFLGRGCSAADIATMTTVLAASGRRETVRQFTESVEFARKVISDLYQQMLLRAPDPGAFDSHTQAVIAGNYHQPLVTIAASPEYWLTARRR